MSVTMARTNEGKRVYRVKRILDKEQHIKDFTCDKTGFKEAYEYDKKLYMLQESIRKEKTEEFNSKGKIKGFFFYTELAEDLSRVKARFNIKRKTKEIFISKNRHVKPGENLTLVFHEMEELYCKELDIDINDPTVNELFQGLLDKFVREYNDMYDVLFLERDKRRK